MLENMDAMIIFLLQLNDTVIPFIYTRQRKKRIPKKRAKWKKENIKIQSFPIMFLFLNYLQFFYFYI